MNTSDVKLQRIQLKEKFREFISQKRVASLDLDCGLILDFVHLTIIEKPPYTVQFWLSYDFCQPTLISSAHVDGLENDCNAWEMNVCLLYATAYLTQQPRRCW